MRKPWWKSKKVWSAGIAFLVAILNEALGIGLDAEELLVAISPLLVYILGESYVDAHK